jgi:2-methylcitrate dehydratase
MSVDRRAFISGSTALISAAFASRSAVAAVSAPGPSASTTAGAPVTVTPFAETRGARSAEPALQTQALAAHIVNAKYSDLDQATLRKAKYRILDLMGCVIGGAASKSNAALVEVLRDAGGTPEASVIGYRLKTSAAQAAMVNATIARSYDFEVMTVAVGARYIGSHDSPTTCMTALALCERGGLSGQEFVTALAVGDDFAARLLAASGLDLGLGWDGAAIYTALPATAIACRLLGLSVQQTQDALGINIDTIAGTNQNTWDGVTDWTLPQGFSARNGILAAQLAKRGWVGIGDALQAPYGFFALYTGGCVHPEILTADLGKVFYAEEYFKPYPACAAAHTSIECALAIRNNNKLSPSQIERVTVQVPTLKSPLAQPFIAGRYPHCAANFSIQFQVANALLHGSVRQEHYDDAAIRGPDLTAMVNKVSLSELPANQSGVQIELTTRDGRSLTEHHPGTPNRYPGVNPFSYEEIVGKFHQQVAFSGFVSSQTADEIIRRVDAIENERNMDDFVKLLTRSHLG